LIVYDLCCGLGGWTEGFQAEGYRAIGYDIEAHEYGNHRYPGELRLKSILDLHGSELADADAIVASPPCQEFSRMAMPFSLGKRIAAALRGEGEFPEKYKGSRTLADLTALFDACFRIQREASIAARRHIPLVVENVKGAQPWVGRATWHYGSFFLWGDVPALMPHTLHRKVNGFNFHQHEKTGEPGGSFQSAAVKDSGQDWSRFARTGEVSPHWNLAAAGVKIGGSGDAYWRKPLEAKRREATAIKSAMATDPEKGGSWFGTYQPGMGSGRNLSSNSPARKAASALIAKIPFELSSHIARCFKPRCS